VLAWWRGPPPTSPSDAEDDRFVELLDSALDDDAARQAVLGQFDGRRALVRRPRVENEIAARNGNAAASTDQPARRQRLVGAEVEETVITWTP
jgi:hypothetical protein